MASSDRDPTNYPEFAMASLLVGLHRWVRKQFTRKRFKNDARNRVTLRCVRVEGAGRQREDDEVLAGGARFQSPGAWPFGQVQ
eukprot:3341563-Pyramimonas_sp.AAC.2